MCRALLPLFLLLSSVAWAQSEPVPIGDKPLETDSFGLTTNSPAWRGLFVSVGFFGGSDLAMDAPRAIAARSNGVDPVLTVSLEYEEKDIDAPVLTVAADLDLFRLSAHFFSGDFDARGAVTVTDGLSAPVTTAVDLKGDFYGFRMSAYWPALRYRGRTLEASLGPALSVGWFHEELDSVPGSPLRYQDSVDELIGTIGPHLSIRTHFDRLSLSLEGEYSVIGGGSEGAVYELTLGIGYRF